MNKKNIKMYSVIRPNIILEIIEGDISNFPEMKIFDSIDDARNYLSDDSFLDIYTDGSCSNYVGGWGYVVVKNGEIDSKKSEKLEKCTNNTAEMEAIKNALIDYPKNDVNIYTDSKYCIGCFTQWVSKWEQNGWKTASGTAVKNCELIKEILSLTKNRKVNFKHVKAHDTNEFNNLADKIANEARMSS